MVELTLEPRGDAAVDAPTEADLRALLPGDARAWELRAFSADVDTFFQETPAAGWDARGDGGVDVRLYGPSDVDGAPAGPLTAWRLGVVATPSDAAAVATFVVAAILVISSLAGYVALLYWLAGFVPLALLYVVGALGIFASLALGLLLAIGLVVLASRPGDRRREAAVERTVQAILDRGGDGRCRVARTTNAAP